MANEGELLVLRHGFTIHSSIVERLVALETRGLRFRVAENGRVVVEPSALLTPRDRAWLHLRAAEVQRAIAYVEAICAEDAGGA